eukprot:199546_1
MDLQSPDDIMNMRTRQLKSYITKNSSSNSVQLHKVPEKDELQYLALDSHPYGWSKQILRNLPQQIRRYFIEDKIKRCMNILNENYDRSNFVKYIEANMEQQTDINTIIDEIMLILKRSDAIYRDTLLAAGFICNDKKVQHKTPVEVIHMCFKYFHVEALSKLNRKRYHAKQANLLSETFEIEQQIVWQIATFFPLQKIGLLKEILKNWASEIKNDESTELTKGKCHQLFVEKSNALNYYQHILDEWQNQMYLI